MMVMVIKLLIIVSVSRNECNVDGRCEFIIVSVVRVKVMFVVVGMV